MIGLDEMVEALGRWQEFVDVAAPVDLDERVAEIRRRLDAGGKLRDVLAEVVEDDDHKVVAGAVRARARGAGLDDQAYAAFILGMPALLRELHELPVEKALETAAFAGLIVGLTARQLADELDR